MKEEEEEEEEGLEDFETATDEDLLDDNAEADDDFEDFEQTLEITGAKVDAESAPVLSADEARRQALIEEEKRRFDNCPGCERRRLLEEKFSESEIRRARIEMIKNRILTNLRLPRRPNVTASRSTIPSQLLKVFEFDDYNKRKRPRQDDDDDAPKATQVFIFGEGK